MSADEVSRKLDQAAQDLQDTMDKIRRSRFKREGDEDDGEGGGSHVREPVRPKPKDSSGGAVMTMEDDECPG